jgi:hypothetical protein
MRSPLGPLFANIFLSFHEADWLNNCPTTFKPLLYRRYVDDCFLIFHSANHVPQFLSFLNSQHPNIKFTCEIESNSTLPFLDISITRKNSRFETSVYQKPTFTGLFTNFHSFIPFQYWCCLISSLLYRFFSICSSYENFHVQLELFRKVFNRNGYPTRLFDRCRLRTSFLGQRFSTQSRGLFCAQDSYVLLSPIHWFTFSANWYSNFSTWFFSVSPFEYKICLSPNSTPLTFLPLRTKFPSV